MSDYEQQLKRYKAKNRTHALSLLTGAIIVPIALFLYLSHLSSKLPTGSFKGAAIQHIMSNHE